MCGIFGVAGGTQQEWATHAKLLRHRGPDDFGEYGDPKGRAYLSHCRLAIVDLSSCAHQPMSNEDGTVWLTYNGEIYNFAELRGCLEQCGHVFRSHSDTEVILHAYEEWGIDCIRRFNGMFAFALWDQTRGRMLLARDRIGVKPLYYLHDGVRLAFASEPKALVSLPFYRKGVDGSALATYLMHGYVAGERSIWKGIRRLLPAHYAVFDVGARTLVTRRYWSLAPATREWGEDEALDQLDSLMTSSVKGALMGDLPVGVFLSGGIDSTSIATAAARQNPRLNTCCIGFEGWAFSESASAQETARRLGTRHHEATMSVQSLTGLAGLFDAYDEPLGDTSIFPTFLLAREARRCNTVVLSGDGGDELFGGYEWYSWTVACRRRKKALFCLFPFLRVLGWGRTSLGRRCDPLEHFRRMSGGGFDVRDLCRMLPRSVLGEILPDETDLYRGHDRHDLHGYLRWQYIDTMTYLVDNNLAKVDRASMAQGLEVRLPFLDHRLVEFAFSLPESLRVRGHEKKYLLRRSLERQGLDHVLPFKKQGFSCPVGLYCPTSDLAAEVRSGALCELGIFDRSGLHAVLERSIRNAETYRVWLLWVLEKWCRRWLAGRV